MLGEFLKKFSFHSSSTTRYLTIRTVPLIGPLFQHLHFRDNIISNFNKYFILDRKTTPVNRKQQKIVTINYQKSKTHHSNKVS